MKTYEAIVKGENIPEPGVPESFKVLIKELQSIGLDIKVLSEDAQEIVIQDDDDDVNETARELDLDVNGVEPAQAASADKAATEADDYDEDAADDEGVEEDIIADMDVLEGDEEHQGDGGEVGSDDENSDE